MSCPKVVRIVTPGPPGPGLTLTGPALAGRISGTGTLVPIPLGPNLGIVDGALTLTGAGSGTVTSVGLSVPTGFSVDNSPITGSGTLAISFTSGYSLPTTAKQGQWDQAYADLGQARTPTVHGHAIADVSGLQTALGAKADLVSGLVPASQLPSFVVEFANLAAFPVTGEAGKLYIALNTNKQYRWAGSTYQEINPSPGSTDAIPEGSVNLYHTTLRAAAAAPVQSVAGKTGTVTLAKGDVGLGNVDNTSDADKPVSTATATALGGKAGTGAIGSSGLTMATARLLGRTTAGAGAVEEIQVSGGTFANGVLTLSGLPSTLTADANGNLTFTARWIQSANGAASAPPMSLTGTWFTGGTSTTTKPQLLIEPAGTTSANWSTAGTGFGVNAASGFLGDLAWFGVGGARKLRVMYSGAIDLSGGDNIGFGGGPSNGIGLYFGSPAILRGDVIIALFSPAGLAVRSGALLFGSNEDLQVFRDAPNTFAQRNTLNPQTYRIYNTFTDASNYERLALKWNSNAFQIEPEAAGTGVIRPLQFPANGIASTPPVSLTGTWFTGGTSTTTKPQFLIEPAGTTSTSWSTAGTGLGVNAPSGFAGNLLDLQVNGTRMLRCDAAGSLRGNNSNYLADFYEVSTQRVEASSYVRSPIFIFGAYTTNVSLFADAANALAQRNGANAQTFRVYNTFTSDTNFERGKLEWSGNVFRIGTEKGGGGGTARAMELQTDGTTRLTLAADGSTITVASGTNLVANHRLTGSAPDSATATGTSGDVRSDADYIYICTATNTWKRAAITTW